MSDFNTAHLQAALLRLRAGDPAARGELVQPALKRLETLARKMLRGFPGVRRWEDTADVLQQALLRLLRALEQVDVPTTRDYFALAGRLIRRELLDMARHYQGARGLGKNYRSGFHGPEEGKPADPADPVAADDLDRWTALHEAVEALPDAEREVFALTFYHGWKQGQIAELVGVSARTVRNRYLAAIVALKKALGDFTFDA